MAQNTPAINLLRTRGKNFFDKFIDWALTFGRIVVIATEIIALCAFLYRFSLDRQLVDLHDQIELKDTYVRALKTNEEKYRNLQERLALSSTLTKNTTETVTLFKDIIGIAPADFVINNLRISEENIRIDANVQSVSSLTNFIDKLKKYPRVESVSLDTIENKTSRATIAVNISAQFKKETMKLKAILLNQLQQTKYLEMLPDFQEKKTQAFVTITLTLITLSIFGLFAISPTLSIIAELQKKLEDSVFVNQKLEEKIRNLAILQQKYNTLQNDLPFVFFAIPKTPTAPLLTGQLHALANTHTITVTRIQVFEVDLTKAQQVQKNNYSSFAFTFEGTGTYSQIADFLQDLAAFERIVTIDSFTIAGEQVATGKQQFNLRGKTYFKS